MRATALAQLLEVAERDPRAHRAARSGDGMLTYTGVGTPDSVRAYVDEFQQHTGADELVVVHHASTVEYRLRSLELLAKT